jgi:hypothetical protein
VHHDSCGHTYDVRLDTFTGYNNHTNNNNGGSPKNREFDCRICEAYNRGYTGDPLVALEAMRADHRQSSSRMTITIGESHPEKVQLISTKLNPDLPYHPSLFTAGSHQIIKFECDDCGEPFKRSIYDFIKNTNCPSCVARQSSSLCGCAWLKAFDDPRIVREFKVLRPDGRHYRLDGAIPPLKIALEHNGDLWHGNPDIYPSEFLIPKSGLTAGEAWQYTIKKKADLEAMGWIVISMWESEWYKYAKMRDISPRLDVNDPWLKRS